MAQNPKKWHIIPGVGEDECTATKQACEYGEFGLYETPEAARDAFERMTADEEGITHAFKTLRRGYPEELQNAPERRKVRYERRVIRESAGDPAAILKEDRYGQKDFEPPIAGRVRHAERGFTDIVEARKIPEQDNPQNYNFSDPDQRYLAAQERSRRMHEDPASNASIEKNTEYQRKVDKNGKVYYATYSKDGYLHSYKDQPAYIDADRKLWYLEGAVNRNEKAGPAMILGDDTKGEAVKIYMKMGLIHRSDGPAVQSPYEEEYYQNGLRHRVGGPAVVRSNGEREYWDKGVLVRTEEAPENVPGIYRRSPEWLGDPVAVSKAEKQEINREEELKFLS